MSRSRTGQDGTARNHDEARGLVPDGSSAYVRKLTKMAHQDFMPWLPPKAKETVHHLAPKFVKALRLSTRIACWCFAMGLVVSLWINSIHPGPSKDMYAQFLPSMVIAIVFNIQPSLGSTLQSVVLGFAGTLSAVLFSLFLYVLPDPHSAVEHHEVYNPHCAHMPFRRLTELSYQTEQTRLLSDTSGAENPTTPAEHLHQWFCTHGGVATADETGVGIMTFTAFLFYMLFVAIALAMSVKMPFKIFGILTATTFMMNFANPNVDTSNYMSFAWDSALSAMLVAQIAGSLVAILTVALPPITAHVTAQSLAAKTTKCTADLLTVVCEYYCGTSKSLRINVFNSQLKRNRADIQEAQRALEESWWEGFDRGQRGKVRATMSDHLRMLQDLDHRLRLLQICALREQFEGAHTDVMKDMVNPLRTLRRAILDLLMNTTIASSEGHVTRADKETLEGQVQAVRDASKATAREWSRRRKGRALDKELRTESFFILELCSLGRAITDFSEKDVIHKVAIPARPTMKDSIRSMFDFKAILKDRDQMNFIIRSFISLVFAWWWACCFHGFRTALPINVTLMLTPLAGNALVMNLGKMQGTVLGCLAGSVIFRLTHSCHPLMRIVKLLFLFFWELFATFIYQYTADHGFIGMLLAVYGGRELLAPCEDDVTNGEMTLRHAFTFRELKAVAYSLCIVTLVDLALKRDLAVNDARKRLLHAVEICFANLKSFVQGDVQAGADVWAATAKISSSVDAELDVAMDLADRADLEPRFAKGPFKVALLKALCDKVWSIQLNAATAERRSLGAAKGVFSMMQKCPSYATVKKDLISTINDTQYVVKTVIAYDGYVALHETSLGGIAGKHGLSTLEGMESLAQEVRDSIGKEADEAESLEMDQTSCLCATLEMLERITQDLDGMLQLTVESM